MPQLAIVSASPAASPFLPAAAPEGYPQPRTGFAPHGPVATEIVLSRYSITENIFSFTRPTHVPASPRTI